MSSAIQTPSAAHLRSSSDLETLLSSPSHNAFTGTTSGTLTNHVISSIWFGISINWSNYRTSLLEYFLLWPLCVSLLVVSCILEQGTSIAWLRLALCLACFWLVPINIHIRTLRRKFRDRGRESSFIVTTASLSFLFIRAFAMLDGYSMLALIRVPPFLTLAVWIAGHWCNSDVPPDIRFGA